MYKVLDKGRLSVIMLLAAAFVFSAACKKNANTGNTTTTTGGGTTTTTTTGSGTTGGSVPAAGSPTAALRAYYEAGMKKDIATAKRYLSAGSIKVLEQGARNMGMTLDEAMQQNAQQATSTTMPEFTNEKISGDTATVDIKAEGNTLTMHMVQEGGEWKLAMDKVLEDLRGTQGGGGTTTQSQPESGNEDEHGGHEDK